ncbi:MAG: RsmF rRNA methyltransferase first C-terminal domain-containing protein [Lachnospiraceae bacterium]|nr:RsmF rRNA methyltransferase first C-terminal domain-containing protein [Lachnospiraceae bacterium]
MEIWEKTGLPEAFTEKMKRLLGDEAEVFLESYREERRYGLRLNPLKCRDEAPEWIRTLKKIPWAEGGYYYEEALRPGKHPLHEAGLYYIQEPSAMAVGAAMAPKPGERILDLCAAPGGKSTHLAGYMAQEGLLVCNEIHPARAKILSQNVERMGIANAVVTNMEPYAMTGYFEEFFDGIVVDAPCSGEGMFRKDENARTEWSPEHVALCAERQEGILDCAAKMLRAGGRIVYSTCTFSPEENEQTVARFLSRHPEFHTEKPEHAEFFSSGRPEWAGTCDTGILREISDTVRIWPHLAGGEGHFLAFLKKEGEERNAQRTETDLSGKRKKKAWSGEKKGIAVQPDLAGYEEFCREFLADREVLNARRKFETFGENLYLLPEEMPELSGLRILRPGLHVGTIKKGRLEPSHALALFLKKEDVKQSFEIGCKEAADRYLKGETLPVPESFRGWTLVTADGYSLGFGKADRGILKNHYPKGLRRP